jgi:hypothetical protein
VADDGLLIGRDARGNLGFVLCSFLVCSPTRLDSLARRYLYTLSELIHSVLLFLWQHPKFDDEEGEDFQ